tara:strand:- start:7418 stop:8623 length:1206 start_codon:yes stop_codon:yes gene_type:complete
MGLSVTKWRKEVEALWALPETERLKKIENQLNFNRPLNASGEEVTSLKQLYESAPLLKKALREHPQKIKYPTTCWRFNRHTSGTTGEPTHITLSREELGKMLGVRDYCFRHHGLKLGQREARLWSRSECDVKSRVKNFLMNRRGFHPVGIEARRELLELLHWRPDYIYGYASLLLEAAKILDKLNVQFKPPKCVVCTAESILPSQKVYISNKFKAPVVEEYGSTEFDVIAFECLGGHRHLVNPWVVVEEGENGCLVSDVSRKTQGLIRYNLGDMIKMSETEFRTLGNSIYIEELQGRTINRFFYISESEVFHASVFSGIFDRYFRESNEIFSFFLEQNRYSVLQVFIDVIPRKSESNLREFIEQEIRRKTGASVWVEVFTISDTEKRSKRNYFQQNIKLPI